jgi:hypothetical protein
MNSYETRVKELCAKALNAEGEELTTILTELQTAMREHAINAQNDTLSYPIFRRAPLNVSRLEKFLRS